MLNTCAGTRRRCWPSTEQFICEGWAGLPSKAPNQTLSALTETFHHFNPELCLSTLCHSSSECSTTQKKQNVYMETFLNPTWDGVECKRKHTCPKLSWATSNWLWGLVPVQVPADGTQQSVMLFPLGLCDRGSSAVLGAAPSSPQGFRGTGTPGGDSWWHVAWWAHSWLGKHWDLLSMFWTRCCKESWNVVCILKHCVGLWLFVCGLSNAVQWHRLHHLISFQFWLQLPAGDSELPTVIKM